MDIYLVDVFVFETYLMFLNILAANLSTSTEWRLIFTNTLPIIPNSRIIYNKEW